MGSLTNLVLRQLEKKEVTLLLRILSGGDQSAFADAEEIWTLDDGRAFIKINSLLEDSVEIGWRSTEEGKGYATEAVRQYLSICSVRAVCAIIDRFNIASQRVAEKNKFEIFHHTEDQLYYRKTLWHGSQA